MFIIWIILALVILLALILAFEAGVHVGTLRAKVALIEGRAVADAEAAKQAIALRFQELRNLWDLVDEKVKTKVADALKDAKSDVQDAGKEVQAGVADARKDVSSVAQEAAQDVTKAVS